LIPSADLLVFSVALDSLQFACTATITTMHHNTILQKEI